MSETLAPAAPKLAAYRQTDIQARGLRFGLGHWPSDGPPVLLLHGLTSNHLAWGVIAPQLQAAGFDVWGLDLRGRGRSDKPSSGYGLEVHAADVFEIWSRLQLAPVHVVGHSLGALVSLFLAAGFAPAVQKLVLVDGGGIPDLYHTSKIFGALQPALSRLGQVYRSTDDYLAARQAANPASRWGAPLEAYYRYEIEAAPRGGVRCNIPVRVVEEELQGMGGSLSPQRLIFDWFGRRSTRAALTHAVPYAAVKAPTLIIRAEADNLQPGDQILPEPSLARMQAELPDARLLRLPNLDHYGCIFDSAPARDSAIIEFLQS